MTVGYGRTDSDLDGGGSETGYLVRPAAAVGAGTGVVLPLDGGGGGEGLGAMVGSSGSSGSSSSSSVGEGEENDNGDNNGGSSGIDFDDPAVADLPRILLMGPRRGGKTSIQRVVFHKMSPHETLFRLEATQTVERAVVDHTPLCRFTIWDFPGDYYGSEAADGGVGGNNPTMVGQVGVGPDGMVVGPGGGPGEYFGAGGAGHHGLQRQPPAHATVGGGGAVENGGGDADGNGESDGAQQEKADDDGDAYVFGRATALIFVIDAQDEPYDHVLQSFTETVTRAVRANPHVAIEVFINKVDGELFLSDEAKYDCRRDVMQQVSDELADAGVDPGSVPISYHLTSIYDHSVFEAFSRVVQRLIPQLPTLENLLNVLVSTCSMEKAYLFDVASKLYISTDSSPVDMQSVELCSDMIDVVLDVSGIYGLRAKDASMGGGGGGGGPMVAAGTGGSPALGGGGGEISSSLASPADIGSLASDLPDKAADTPVINPDDAADSSNVGGGDLMGSMSGAADSGGEVNDELVGTLISQSGAGGVAVDDGDDEDDVGTDSAYDSESSSVIQLSNGMVLFLREVDTMLALVCLTRSENFRKKSLINYNIGCLKKALRSLVQMIPEQVESED